MLRILAVATALLLFVIPVCGATRTWSGAVSEQWSVAGNWVEGIVPAAGDVLVFPAGSRQSSVNDLPDVAYHSLQITSAVSINTNSVTPGSPAITVTNGVTTDTPGGVYIHGLVATAPQTWVCGGSCTFRGAIINASLTTQTTAPDGRLALTSPGGIGDITHTGGMLQLGTFPNMPSTLDGMVTVNGGKLLITGSHDSVAVHSNITCDWNGCSGGLDVTPPARLRSVTAQGGYLRSLWGIPAEFGKLDLGSVAELNWTVGAGLAHILVDDAPQLGGDGTVTLGGSGLMLALPATAFWDVTPGVVRTLIDNDGTDPIAGTFAGLPEGATVRVPNGQRFRISYVGGDDNDVTVTALAHYSPNAEFDNDGFSEVLWRHGDSGQNFRWIMNGSVQTGGAVVNAVPDQDWQIAALADFDGDGDSDVFWRHAVTGANYLYRMEGGAIAEAGPVNQVPDLNWQVAATGDLDGDGRADILWRNELTGETYLYLMNGFTIEHAGPMKAVAAEWKIAGTADFDVDGRSDVLWNNIYTGEIYVWLMRGSVIVSEKLLATFPGWTVAGIGQFNSVWPEVNSGDRFPDLVMWNAIEGRFEIHRMTWNTTLGALYSSGSVTEGWSIATSGDYNRNGVTDLIWRNGLTGENYIYLFKSDHEPSGPRFVGAALPAVTDLDWQIIR